MSGIDGILVSPVSALLATMILWITQQISCGPIYMKKTADFKILLTIAAGPQRVKLTCQPPLGGRGFAQNDAHKLMFHVFLAP